MIRGAPEDHVAAARATSDPARRQLLAFYAAGAAHRDGIPISACPFELGREDDLRASWFRFYDIVGKAVRKTVPAMPNPEDRRKPRRQYVPPKRVQVQTSSPAYAEQMGAAFELMEDRQ